MQLQNSIGGGDYRPTGSGSRLVAPTARVQVQDTDLAKIATKQLAAANKVATQGANAKSVGAKAVATQRIEENKDKK